MRLPKFDYFAPTTLDEALRLIKEQGEGACLVSGGTDLVVKMIHGRLKPKAVISLQGVEALNGVRFHPEEGLTIAANARLAEVASHPDILEHYPSLAYAVQCMANVEVRNMGTVAGNLCNAAPSADTAPPLMTMNAQVTLTSRLQGERRLYLNEFFRGPGITAMAPDEIMTTITLPIPPPNSGASYKRISGRCGVDIAAVGVGVAAVFDGESCSNVRIVLGAVAPVPLAAVKTEALLKGEKWTPDLIAKAGDQAANEAKPITDVRATAEWRKAMVAVLTRRSLQEAYERTRARR
jgi:carbon-monoxide dehydrogenase medium subunit